MADVKLNSNVAKIPTSPGVPFFYKWLSFLHPFNNLTKTERQVLASLLNKRQELSNLIPNENIVEGLIKSPAVRKEIRDSIDIKMSQFNMIYSALRKKGVIVDDKINKKYIPNVEFDSNEYRLVLIFDINEKHGLSK